MSTLPRRVTECDLKKMRSEHDAYEALHKAALRRERLLAVVGRVPLELVHDASIVAACRGGSCHQGRLPCRERCGAEMATAESDAPTVPTRRLPTKPRLSVWRRLILLMTRLSACIRRT